MLLQRLEEYASLRFSLPPTLYVESPVRYIIELDGSGGLLTNRPTDTSDPTSRSTRRGQRRQVPQVQRSSGIKPLLLADNAEYTLGVARERSSPDRVSQCHQAYLELLQRCLAATGEPTVQAVYTFLSSNPTSPLELADEFDRGATITFRVDGVFPVDLPSVQAFWAEDNDPGRSDAPIMQCLVCGEERPVLPRLQAKIKGVPGGQTAGTSIISANAEAFESYGLSASLIAPTCAQSGERFTQAANSLLASQTNRIVLGGVAYVFWTREDVEFDFLTLITGEDATQVQSLIESVRSGQWYPEIDDTAFFATALSGSGGRVVVRSWLDTTVGEVKRHLAAWFRRQSMVQPNGEPPRPLGLNSLAYATVREPRDLAPPTPRALLQAAMTDSPLQWDLLYQAVRRNRAEQRVTHPRAALIKLVLLSQSENDDDMEDYMVQLDPDHPSPAYHCGRLLAVLEEIQRAAMPGVNATIVDRFYGTASSAPASVFSRLTRGAQPHLSKLERDRPGAYHALQRRLEDILEHIPGRTGFPRTLNLEGQGLFTLGYYHQRAHDRGQAREAAQRRRQGQSVAAAADLPLEAVGPPEQELKKEEEE